MAYFTLHPSEPDVAIGYGIGFVSALVFHVGATSAIISDKHREFTNDLMKKLDTSIGGIEGGVQAEANAFREWYSRMQDGRFKIREMRTDAADAEILRSVSSAEIVKNTYVNLSDFRGAKSRVSGEVEQWYKTFLEDKEQNVWTDIVGVSDFLDGRFHSLEIASDRVGTHNLTIISDSLPIINFLLASSEDKREVYFGWLRSDAANAPVFHSRDSRVVTLFENYARLLEGHKKDSVRVDYSRTKEGRFANLMIDSIRGAWLSVSTSNSTKNPRDYATFSILLVDSIGGNWIVSGRSYERKTKKMLHVIRGQSASVMSDGIVYRFTRSNADGAGQKDGHGIFDLTAASNELAIGVYAVEDDRRQPFHRIRAVKFSNDPTIPFDEFDWSQVDGLIERIHSSKPN